MAVAQTTGIPDCVRNDASYTNDGSLIPRRFANTIALL
jgi:hypothetical protein